MSALMYDSILVDCYVTTFHREADCKEGQCLYSYEVNDFEASPEKSQVSH